MRSALWLECSFAGGTEVALFDYAHFAELLLGATSFILYNATSPHNHPPTVARFGARFGERLLPLDYELSADGMLRGGGVLKRHGVTHLYGTPSCFTRRPLPQLLSAAATADCCGRNC